MGLAWLPSWLVHERIKTGTLVHLLRDRREFLYDAYALWMQTPHLPLRVRLAIDALAAGLIDLTNEPAGIADSLNPANPTPRRKARRHGPRQPRPGLPAPSRSADE